MGFLELRRQCGVSHEVRRGPQGASREVPGKLSLHARVYWGRFIDLDPGSTGLREELPRRPWVMIAVSGKPRRLAATWFPLLPSSHGSSEETSTPSPSKQSRQSSRF